MTTATGSTTTHRRARLGITLSAAILAAGLAGSALAPAQATSPATAAPASSSASTAAFAPVITPALTTDANKDWQRHTFTDPYVGKVSIALPKGYMLSQRVNADKNRNAIDVVRTDGIVIATFRSAPPGCNVAPIETKRQAGDVQILQTKNLNLPFAKRWLDDTSPRSVFLSNSDAQGTDVAIGVTNGNFYTGPGSFGAYLSVGTTPIRDEGSMVRMSAYSFGDYPSFPYNGVPSTGQRDFKNVAEAKAYMNTPEFKERWTVVNSLQIDQTGLKK